MKHASLTKIAIAAATLAATLATPMVSSADTVICSFTEPFITTIYDMTKSTLTYNQYDKKDVVVRNVLFQIKGPGLFELTKNGKVIQTLTLSMKGSDGMSELIYPYDVKDEGMVEMANGGFGGCISNHLHSKDGEP